MRELDALEAGATRLETPCGDGTLVWRRWNAGGRHPLVLLHGGSGNWLHWVRQIPVFAARRTVLAADLPGLGESADPPGPERPGHRGQSLAEGAAQMAAREFPRGDTRKAAWRLDSNWSPGHPDRC